MIFTHLPFRELISFRIGFRPIHMFATMLHDLASVVGFEPTSPDEIWCPSRLDDTELSYWLAYKGSNPGFEDQNLVCYQLHHKPKIILLKSLCLRHHNLIYIVFGDLLFSMME